MVYRIYAPRLRGLEAITAISALSSTHKGDAVLPSWIRNRGRDLTLSRLLKVGREDNSRGLRQDLELHAPGNDRLSLF